MVYVKAKIIVEPKRTQNRSRKRSSSPCESVKKSDPQNDAAQTTNKSFFLLSILTQGVVNKMIRSIKSDINLLQRAATP
ncbi:hypothetical protein KIN20_024875 [Parelaphostrongylus tenuis]|uniref:Uncharacterized protein n=1 Tax=Parelaphostrongylus tenuis TaxID=148309 RepID=A0AAD5ND12_PARTN|nr:hypothetical protein KIN20_024875 [Parelaphostrongylus tenuis]